MRDVGPNIVDHASGILAGSFVVTNGPVFFFASVAPSIDLMTGFQFDQLTRDRPIQITGPIGKYSPNPFRIQPTGLKTAVENVRPQVGVIGDEVDVTISRIGLNQHHCGPAHAACNQIVKAMIRSS